jgi:hypothetical protein
LSTVRLSPSKNNNITRTLDRLDRAAPSIIDVYKGFGVLLASPLIVLMAVSFGHGESTWGVIGVIAGIVAALVMIWALHRYHPDYRG